jgi:hypothetical protein
VDIRESMLLALLCTVDREQSHVLAVKIRGTEELVGPSTASPYSSVLIVIGGCGRRPRVCAGAPRRCRSCRVLALRLRGVEVVLPVVYSRAKNLQGKPCRPGPAHRGPATGSGRGRAQRRLVPVAPPNPDARPAPTTALGAEEAAELGV